MKIVTYGMKAVPYGIISIPYKAAEEFSVPVPEKEVLPGKKDDAGFIPCDTAFDPGNAGVDSSVAGIDRINVACNLSNADVIPCGVRTVLHADRVALRHVTLA